MKPKARVGLSLHHSAICIDEDINEKALRTILRDFLMSRFSCPHEEFVFAYLVLGERERECGVD